MKERKNVLLALSWYNVEIHRGVADFAKKHNWNLCCEPVAYPGYLPEGWEGDGIISHLNDPKKLAFVKQHQLDVVSLGGATSEFDCDSLKLDHADICRQGAEYLLDKGYKRFAWFTHKVIEKPIRLGLFKDFLPIGFPCTHLKHPTMVSWKQNREAMINELRKIQFPLAVFCSDDNAAAEVITACLDYGIKVPEEVAVLGINNDSLVCESLAVSLSSVNTDHYHMGYLAAYLLDRRMRGKSSKSRQLVMKTKGVVTRKSTSVIAVDHPEVAKALRFIHENFNKGISVKDVVRRTNFTECGLSRAFQEELGRTIGQELRHVKISTAEDLLLNTSRTIDQIAVECGFGNYHGFYEAFKREKGMTPKQFRRQ